jgi:glutaminase
MAFISTGHLPVAEQVRTLVQSAYQRFQDCNEGTKSSVYPALAAAPGDRFGISLTTVNGAVFNAGDAGAEFTIMSVSKPFVFAIICDLLGPDVLAERVGADATGRAFDSVAAIEQGDGRTNPMVNPGAIAVTSLCPGDDIETKWQFLLDELSRFAGKKLEIDSQIFQSAMKSNFRNRSISRLLQACGKIYCDPDEALELYTRQCSLRVTSEALAAMGATLADGGVQPFTQERVIEPITCHYTLASMVTAGLYERSGSWLYEIGLPGKSGIAGGMLTVSPGKGALSTYAPLLDQFGNSVKGQKTAKFLSQELGLDLFISSPAHSSSPSLPIPEDAK